MGRDTIQHEESVSTISHEYLLEFTSKYGIPESLHPELPGPEEPIVEFSKGKVGVYTKFFEFTNYHIPISEFLFNILGHYQIHLSRLKRPGKNTPHCYTKPFDSLKNWNNWFFWVDKRVFPTVVEWRTNAPKDKMPSADSYSSGDVAILNTRRTLIQKQLEALLCLVGLSQRYFLGDDVYLTFLYDDDHGKDNTRHRAAHEVPLLTATASRFIDMEDTAVASGSLGTPSALENLPLDFTNEDSPKIITKRGETEQVQDELAQGIPHVENVTTTEVVPEPSLEKEVAAMGPPVNKKRRRRAKDEAEANAPPKGRVTRRYLSAGMGNDQQLLLRYPGRMLRHGGSHSIVRVSNLQAQVTDEEKIKAAFEEFKRYEDDRVEQRCAKIDARLDKLSVDFDEELYQHMLTAIAGRHWVIGYGLCLAIIKCAESLDLRQAFADVVSAGLVKGMSEGLKHGIEHRRASRDLAAIEAYDPKADSKFPTYLEVCDPEDPWAFKEEVLLEDAITANKIRAKKKKKKCRVVCCTHGVGSAHHARFDDIPVFVPTVAS
nr:hypothetical protein [Tanacetum cinerariifolium]